MVLGAFPATAAFVVVRNHLRLEDEEFLVALSLACAVAALVSFSFGTLLGCRARRSSLLALGSVALVPLLYVNWLIVWIGAYCVVGGQTCYS